MGTTVVVDVRDDDVPEASLDEVFAWLRWVDEMFSTYKPESQISRLARGALAFENAHADVREVLGRCEQLRVATAGFFDVHAAARDGGLDPSALVKGWSVDRAGELLDGAGARNYAINAGGDVDTYHRYVYIHGTNHEDQLGKPQSAGCVLMNNLEIIELFDWVRAGDPVLIE